MIFHNPFKKCLVDTVYTLRDPLLFLIAYALYFKSISSTYLGF